MRKFYIVFQLLLFAFSVVVQAEDLEDLGIYERSLSQSVEVPFSLLPGENIDFRTGSNYWEIPGPSVPGQGGLDINVGFSFNKAHPSGYFNLGSWELEIPRIVIYSNTSVTGHTSGTGYTNKPQQACSDTRTLGNKGLGAPSGENSPISLILPGIEPQTVLERNVERDIYPSSVKYVTTGNYIISCVDNGTTFKVVSPDSITYEFNVLSSTVGFHASTGNGRLKNYPGILTVYPKSIYDPWGNKLTFSYYDSSAAHPSPLLHTRKLIDKIQANDGRLVDFTHSSEANPKLEKITVDRRAWTFKYESESDSAKYLKEIVLPEGLKWSIKYDKDSNGGENDAVLGLLPKKTGKEISISYKYQYAIKEMITPTGASVNYTYSRVTKGFWGIKACCGYVPTIKTRTVSGNDITAHSSSFTFTHQQNGKISRSQIVAGNRKDVLDFHRNVWQHGLLDSHTIYQSGKQILKREFSWGRGSKIGETGLENEHESGQTLRWSNNVTTIIDGKTLTTAFSGRDNLGNPSKVTETGTRTRVTRYTYHNDTSKWFIGKVKEQSVDGVSDVLSYTYDKNKVKTATENKLKQTLYYHSNGNLSEIRKTVGGNLERKYYDNYYRGVARKFTDEDSFVTTATVDYFGNVKRITDPESNWVEYEYDSMGRVSKEKRPGRADVIITWPSAKQKNITQGSYRDIEKYNALGQLKYKKTWDTAYTSEPVIHNKEYTNRGMPFFTAWPSETEGETRGVKQYYDVLDRLTKVTNTVSGKSKAICYGAGCIQSGEPSISYGIRTVNEKGIKTIMNYDVYGNPSETYLKDLYRQKTSGSSGFVKTSHARNVKGVLISVTQGGVKESYSYKSGTQYIEKVSRPEIVINTSLDEQGQIIERWFNNDRSQVAKLNYTKNDRLESIDYPAPTYDVLFNYYKNGALKRARRVNSAGNPTHNLSDWNYSYYSDGTMKSEVLSVGGENYSLQYGYNSQGNVNSVVYPSGESINLATDGLGRDRALFNEYSGKSNRYLVNSVKYHPNDAIEKINFANGLSQSYGVDSQMRVDSISVPGRVNLKYEFDYLNNISAITDYIDGGRRDSFTYDGLNRLEQANGSWGNYTYAYSDSGNILRRDKSNGDSLGYQYDSNNQLSSVYGDYNQTYKYDSQGNVTQNSKNYFTYDFAGNALGMGTTSKADDWVYEYDAHNKRVINYAGRGEYISMYGHNGKLMAEVDTNGNVSEYYYLNGELLTRRDNCVSFSDAQGNCRTKMEWILPSITLMMN
ncbi:RHS repeat domain-containing protein [Microbulbifer sp. JTAC008]|uniref:RHS repeat domain-containing protein n=1 Tax=Microbulbifer sp. JTAC008 TaxID=3243374 RepID=UPI0040393E27